MSYDCTTCGQLPQDDHDGRDGTHCLDDCIPDGECRHASDPAIKGLDGLCYWRGQNGQTTGWYSPDPAHEKRTEVQLGRAPHKPLPGQIGFDGSVRER